jgi:hypothetical protein
MLLNTKLASTTRSPKGRVSKGRVPTTCRWVYDIKKDKDDGYKQQEGIDFNKTFSSTAQIRTFRFVVVAVHKGLKITQYDIGNAFLNSKLEEEICMEWPPGYPSESKNSVVKLY